ncbi:MAG: hypothetical protein J6S85_06575 [Methanobrevibacter sp.]|nr:hypothetical protein [Methanobrevibacter sp.]
MAIKLPDGKISRTLPEQVGHLTHEIDKIWGFLDGINVQDNLVKVAASSGTLNSEEMQIVSRDVAFIEYSGNLYVKANATATEFVFKQIALNASDQGTYNILQSFRIVITKASGAYAYSANTVLSLYNKAEMDTLLAAKADGSALTAGLALKADLAGANFTGAITSPSIIEDMAGYSFVKGSPSQMSNMTYNYAGIVKNGNKLTYAIALTATVGDSNIAGNTPLNFGRFNIPSAILAKLFPYTQGGLENVLEDRIVNLRKSDTTTGIVEALAFAIKGDAGITAYIYPRDTLLASTSYNVRIEVTFLLSDNLAV